jgi:hypothetical protein
MRKSALLMVLFASPVVAGDCKNIAKATYAVGYVEETVVVKRPVTIMRTPVIETREKQVTVKENVVVGYKEEVVDAVPVLKRNPLAGLLHKLGCAACN